MEFEINLQQMARVKVAILFWELKEVQDNVNDYLDRLFDLFYTNERFNNLIISVMKDSLGIVLPLSIQSQLNYTIREIGKKIRFWYIHVKNTWRICKVCNGGRDFVTKIYWTQYGTIDEVKIFKSSCVAFPMFNIAEIYNTPCDHFAELCNTSIDSIGTYGKCKSYLELYRSGNHRELGQHMQGLVRNNAAMQQQFHHSDPALLNVYMLKISVCEGNSLAVEYVWGKMNEKERRENLVKMATFSFLFYRNWSMMKDIFKYLVEQYLQIFMFFFNKMTIQEKEILYSCLPTFNWSIFILQMLMDSWPWQDHLIPVFSDLLRCSENGVKLVKEFLHYLKMKISDTRSNGDVYYNYFQNIYYKVIYNLPDDMKGVVEK
uniref:Uncharacterized protein n=1 Tax=Clastoptera arizonana TaxID=38151 RepID=A0A1B6CJT2_9HEMI